MLLGHAGQHSLARSGLGYDLRKANAKRNGMDPADHIKHVPHVQTEALRVVFGNAWSKFIKSAVLSRGESAPLILAALFEIKAWHPWLEEAERLLSLAERDKVRRKRHVSDREELVLAYALHRLVMGSFLLCDPAGIELERDLLGRPFVQGDEVNTSLSHTSGAIAVAVSPHGFVGIDIEPAMRAKELPGIASVVLHASEVVTISRLPEAARAQALLALWVRKEALLKASGIGLVREMHSFEAPHGQPVGLPAADGSQGVAAIAHMLEAGSSWVAAIAMLPEARFHAAWLLPQDMLSGLDR